LCGNGCIFAYEYCGVTEIDSAGELTVDHHHPPGRGGATNDPENLVYCCAKCNQYKSDYWPRKPTDPVLWNPRSEQRDAHMLTLANGTVYPLSPSGTFTIRRLRLNRPPLVAYRLRRQAPLVAQASARRGIGTQRTAALLR
jgi:hypothetical protein